MEDKIKFFLSLKNYDIKIHQDARWIDQNALAMFCHMWLILF